MLFVWTINGQILSAVNTEDVSPFGQTSHIILCVAFSTMNEWDIKNVIMCGGSDGIVRLYSMVLEECGSPRRDMPTKSTSHPKSAHSTAVGLQQIFERQRQKLKAASISVGSFETVSRDSRGGSPEFPGTPNLESDSCGSPSWINGSLEPGVWKMGTPASTDDQQQHWRRVLVLRNTLTMHTAFARKDNTRPAPITALTASRDNKSLFVGDGVGRVWHWQMGEESGVRADHWIQDPSRNECTQCQQRFSLAERRHHCRNCGHIFCSRCSRFESDIAHMKISKPVRVCQNCYLRLKAQTSG
ncbi:hypothetical protein AB6A40_010013 [Gnathostoma spinigerum]|uniref:FYVE-type domain-containing protein n=1 Tax=Gnathostoma spinigerum TaxID=75299 RepID=A0ABD6EYT5_9BILA